MSVTTVFQRCLVVLALGGFLSPESSAAQTGAQTAKTVAFTASEQAWIENKKIITVGFDRNWPPYSYLSSSGKFEGIAVDITERLAKRLGLELAFYEAKPWPELYSDGITGQVDVIATIYPMVEREQWFDFTRPYLSVNSYITVDKRNRERFGTLLSLTGRRVALVSGYAESDAALRVVEDIQAIMVENIADAMRLVATGKVDAAIADIASASHIIAREGYINLTFTEDVSRRFGSHKISYGGNKQNAILTALLDKALETLSYAELYEIYSRWNTPKLVKPESGFLTVKDVLTDAEKTWLREHPVVRLASNQSWPPYESIDQGQFVGICADYIKLLEEKLDIRFQPSPQAPWQQLLNRLKNRQLDILSCASATPDRRNYIDFTTPFIKLPLSIIARDDVGFIGGIHILQGKTIAVEEGFSTEDYLRRSHPELQLRTYPDTLAALQAVAKGDAFAYVGDMASTNVINRRNNIGNLAIAGQISHKLSIGMGVRSDWPKLASILDKAVGAISIAEHTAIQQKWAMAERQQPFNSRLLWQLGSLAALIIIAVLLWNRSLARKVKQRTEQLLVQEHYDNQTGLPNRLLAFDRLTQMLKESEEFNQQAAVLIVHLDKYQAITDTIGFEASDQLLKEIARRFSAIVGSGDTLARIGEADFVVLLGQVSETNAIINCAEKLQSTLREKLIDTDRDFKISATIGIAVYPDNADNAVELAQKAHSAMQHALTKGRGRFSFFTDSLNRGVARRVLLEEHMHRAVKNHSFELHYQPVVDIKNQRISGLEALLRWRHEDLGNISPEEFIPIAENNELIIDIGKQVLEQAIIDTLRIQQSLSLSLNIAVNLSPIQLQEEGFAYYLSDLLHNLHFAPERLELEITEGILIKSESRIAAILNRIKDIGVTLSMDDFGTGYSSLFYLRKYPFDVLKIDREFVWDLDESDSNKLLVSAATSMGHSLGMKVIAEGVEKQQHHQHLINIGCDYCQGYFFSKPLPMHELIDFLGKQPTPLQANQYG